MEKGETEDERGPVSQSRDPAMTLTALCQLFNQIKTVDSQHIDGFYLFRVLFCSCFCSCSYP